METYNYVVITKDDCADVADDINKFSSAKLNALLTQYGEGGFRVISTLYNSPHDWVLILSRPKNAERPGRMG